MIFMNKFIFYFLFLILFESIHKNIDNNYSVGLGHLFYFKSQYKIS